MSNKKIIGKRKAVKKVKNKGIVVATRKDVCIQGKRANFTGKTLENFVEDALVAQGAYSVMYTAWANDRVVVPGWAKKVLYKQVHYTKLWGTTGRSDFVIETPKLGSVRIDARYQGVSGSVDEKAPYLIATAEKCYPEKDVIIVLDGPGVKPEVRRWMIDKATAIKQKNIRIMTKKQFAAWAKSV